MTAKKSEASASPPRQAGPGSTYGYDALSEALLHQYKGLGKLLSSVLHQYIDMMSDKVQAAGFSDIRAVHIRILREIGLGGVSVTAVAGKVGITKQAASQMVKELIALGYVRLLVDPGSKRSRVILLTDRGVALVLAIREAVAEMQSMMVERLGPQVFHQMVTGLITLGESGVFRPDAAAGGTARD
jgi:DNA-binding MarR family transcriptional regulator